MELLPPPLLLFLISRRCWSRRVYTGPGVYVGRYALVNPIVQVNDVGQMIGNSEAVISPAQKLDTLRVVVAGTIDLKTKSLNEAGPL